MRSTFPASLVSLVATLVTLAGPARGAITAQARAVVDRHVEASGGAAALESERSVHVKGRMRAMELKGTFEQWSQVPDRLAMRVNLGSLRLRTGYDGRVGWETDLSSKRVRTLEGKELEKLQSDAYFENEMWARADQGGGEVRYGSTSFRTDDKLVSIDVKPPVGPSRRLWFSAKTGLLVRVVTRVDQHDSETWLSAYRTFEGRKKPTLQRPTDGNVPWADERDEPDRIVADSLWVNAPVDSALFAPPATMETGVTWLKTQGEANVPFRYGTRHVWIKVSINGEPPMDFLLDTGASTTAIDRDYARRLGLLNEGRFGVQGMGGEDEASFARVRSVRIAGPGGDGVTIRDLKVGVVDLGERHEEVLWRKMGGLIGYDVLSRFVVRIDYDRQVITFSDPKRFTEPDSGAALDMKLMSGVPVVTVRLDEDCSGDFLVDVGNSFGLLVHGSLVRNCRMFSALAGHKQVQILSGGVGAGFRSWLCRLDTLRIGPFALHDPIAGLSLSARGMVGSKDYGGNIGNGVLERFRCTFDYERRKLYLEPGARFDRPDRYSRLGALFLRSRERVVASGILRGSAADEAGLKANDEVVEIDGRPVLSYTPEEMDRLFVDGEPGSTHTLTIVRDGERTRLTLTLRDVI